MRKRKSPSVLNSRVVRVQAGDYAFLVRVSEELDISMADALHKVLLGLGQEKSTVIPRDKIPVPALGVISMPTFRVAPVPTFRATPVTSAVVNGSKPVALGVQPKGGKIHE